MESKSKSEIDMSYLKQIDKERLPPACSKIEVSPRTHRPGQVFQELWSEHDKIMSQAICVSSPKSDVQDDYVRFVCISDTHSHLELLREPLPKGDVLLHAGDFTMRGLAKEVEEFDDFMGTLPYCHKIVIAGNHEITFDPQSTRIRSLREQCRCSGGRALDLLKTTPKDALPDMRRLLTHCTYLEDSFTHVCGIKIWGAPWQPEHSGWGFGLKRGRSILERWDLIPNDVDVLMTHGPPLGFGDLTKYRKRVGCVELVNTIRKRVRPAVSVFGHIHEAHGVYSDGLTTYINASICNSAYHAVYKPIVFDMQIPCGHTREELLEHLVVS